MTYGVNGTVLILGGISMHTVMAALMLQPIKWHMKRFIVESEEQVLMQADDSDEKSDDIFVKPGFYIGKQETNACKCFVGTQWENTILSTHLSLVQPKTNDNVDLSSEDEDEYLEKPYNYIDHDVDMQNIYGCEQMPIMRKMSTKQLHRCDGVVHNSYSLKELSKLSDRNRRRLSLEDTYNNHVAKPRKRWFESGGSIDTINLGSAVDIFGQRALDRNESKRLMHSFSRIEEEENKTGDEVDDEERQKNQIIVEKM